MMNIATLSGLMISALVLAAAGCERAADDPAAVKEPSHQEDAPAPPAHAETGHPNWGYDGDGGPAHWGDLAPEYAVCAAGKAQSPIDLIAAAVTDSAPVSVHYQPSPLVILNNGHTVQVNVSPGSTLNNGSGEFALLQIHFHTPSEHTINGAGFPLAAHFVHRDSNGGLGVLGVLFEEGAVNEGLQVLINNLSTEVSEPRTIDGVEWNPAALLSDDLSVYRYSGSLTTPPCSEGVGWNVLSDVQQASAEQIAALSMVMGANARPVQALNGRSLQAPASE